MLYTQVFKGLDKLQILRDVGARDDVVVDGGEKVKEGEEAGKGGEDVTVTEDIVEKEDTVTKEETGVE